MYKTVPLNLPHAKEGQLRLEGEGAQQRRVLSLYPDLSPKDDQAVHDLQAQLNKRLGARLDYDEYIVHLMDGSVIHVKDGSHA